MISAQSRPLQLNGNRFCFVRRFSINPLMRKGLVFIILLSSFLSVAQIDYNKQYFNGKDLFRQGKYALAMETFKPLLTYDSKNPFREYASFFYALSAYRQGYRVVAKDMFNQIKTQNPGWDKISEVNFWLGKIYFDDKDYFQGLKQFNVVSDKTFEKDIISVKRNALQEIADVETLRMMHEEFPKDAVVVRALALSLARDANDEENRKQLEGLISKFNLQRSEFLPEAPKTFHKDKYSVSVLMPFMMSTIDPSPGKKRNQLILDFYEGMKLAADTLDTFGVNVSVRAYDTERSPEKIRTILNTEELKNTDLIVGPFFAEENRLVQEFSQANKINTVHPFSNNSETVGNNPHAFLFQPSAETIGNASAKYLGAHTHRKNCMVFYGPAKKDSTMAASFIRSAPENGLKVVHAQRIFTRDVQKILEILATATEYDEFNYPSQFKLKKDSIGSIYMASDEALIYAKVIAGVEKRGDSIEVIGSENWLEDPALDPDKFETLGVTLTAPNYTKTSSPQYQQFFQNFVKRYGRVPSTFARMGFELMMFYGNQLKTNGVFFQEGLMKAGTLPGYLSAGFDFSTSRDNRLVPFIRFNRGELVLVEKP
jgi:ABC-type branched-subunit amino acid transport system substrate-binding protein